MPAKFLIEVPHDPSTAGCIRAIEMFLRTGSHFVTRAEWGCKGGVHKSWILLDVDTREEALNVVPADFRPQATVCEVTQFTLKQLDEMKRQHQG